MGHTSPLRCFRCRFADYADDRCHAADISWPPIASHFDVGATLISSIISFLCRFDFSGRHFLDLPMLIIFAFGFSISSIFRR